MQPEVIASIVSAVTALVAVAVGPYLGFRASKRQMIGPMRQAWINSLRDTVSEYLSILSISRWSVAASLSDTDEIRSACEMEERNRIQAAVLLKEKICLLTNPTEVDHVQLVELTEDCFNSYNQGGDVAPALRKVRVQTQAILKREWNVIKQ